ncbi:hypothetical protein CEXT_786311 [Caerostris extrusa]|uniref:Uncharacterized protein n=1 Tax=Caerostris extrusa TaxID=172846 RepID=A0AAV4WWH8_CAEEX|nr:hypothetical protein CEXT_786311 [Caerostris extrusa]
MHKSKHFIIHKLEKPQPHKKEALQCHFFFRVSIKKWERGEKEQEIDVGKYINKCNMNIPGMGQRGGGRNTRKEYVIEETYSEKSIFLEFLVYVINVFIPAEQFKTYVWTSEMYFASKSM